MAEIVLDNVRKEFAAPGLPPIDVEVEALEELGSDAHVFFAVDAEPIVVDEARVRLALDPSRLYYFSPETGQSLLDRQPVAA